MNRSAPLLFLLAIGCKAPPLAPTELEELCGFLFGHLDDEDPEALQEGLVNLQHWLGDNLEDTLEGYQIRNLDHDAVSDLDNRKRDVSDLIGAAVATQSGHRIKKNGRVLLHGDYTEIFRSYKTYEREYLTDKGCFVSKECESVRTRNYSETSWAGLVNVDSTAMREFRWVDTEEGWMLAQRSWLVEPADVSLGGIDVHAQYWVGVFVPGLDTKATYLQATWMDVDYGSLPISEKSAKNQIVTSMQGKGEDLEDYLND